MDNYFLLEKKMQLVKEILIQSYLGKMGKKIHFAI